MNFREASIQFEDLFNKTFFFRGGQYKYVRTIQGQLTQRRGEKKTKKCIYTAPMLCGQFFRNIIKYRAMIEKIQ